MNIIIEMFGFIFKASCFRKAKQQSAETSTSSATPFVVLALKEIESRTQKVRPSTIINERTALNAFVKYAGSEIALEDITAECIQGFEQNLAERNISPNASACYLRSLRAVINRLGGSGRELFSLVSTGKKRTGKKAVSAQVIEDIERIEIKDDKKLAIARDTLLISYYAMGMPFVDLANLTKDNIHGDHIVYQRHKTGETVSVLLTPELKGLLNKYKQNNSLHLLPFLNSAQLSYQQYQAILGKHNRWLKKLSDTYHLPKLTTYTARHTWATLAYRRRIDIQVIAKALGHTNPMTTLNYIRDIDYDSVDQACRLMSNPPKRESRVA